MEMPVFPQQFIMQHCTAVQEARRFRRMYKIQNITDQDDCDQADCQFTPAGLGLMCQTCKLHLTRPFLDNKVDAEFLPQIEEYYAKMAEYEKHLKKQELLDTAIGGEYP